jgi:hypothetical protein
MVVPVQRLERRRLRPLREVGRIEKFEEGGGEGDVDAGALDEAEEGTDEVEAEGEVAGGGDEAVSAEKCQCKEEERPRKGGKTYRIAPRAT